MAKDFTLTVYKNRLCNLISAGFSFQIYRDFTEQPQEKVILLRRWLRVGEGESGRWGDCEREKLREGEGVME